MIDINIIIFNLILYFTVYFHQFNSFQFITLAYRLEKFNFYFYATTNNSGAINSSNTSFFISVRLL